MTEFAPLFGAVCLVPQGPVDCDFFTGSVGEQRLHRGSSSFEPLSMTLSVKKRECADLG